MSVRKMVPEKVREVEEVALEAAPPGGVGIRRLRYRWRVLLLTIALLGAFTAGIAAGYAAIL